MRKGVVIASLLGFGALAALAPPRDALALVWPDVPERVERGLASQDPVTRRAAARELGTLGLERATPLVLRALADGDTEVRVAAAKEAIRLRVVPATPVALGWLTEREPRLRVAACEVAFAMPDPKAVPSLARSLGDADPSVRAACADALGASGSPDAVAPLAGKLDDPTPAVRVQVARALAKLGDPRAVVPLVGKVQDSTPEVRQAVVRALGDLGDARATQALLLVLRDNSAEVKMEALAALGRLRAPEAASAIAPLALERNPTVRQAALIALGRIGTPEAIRALVNTLGTQDDGAASLERTAVRDALVSVGPPAIPELTALLERPGSKAVTTSAAWVLGELHATSSAKTIVAALRKGTLPPAAALHALAGAGTAEQVPVVLEFVGDPLVRQEALRTAGILLDPTKPDGRAVEPLAATLRSPRLSTDERAQLVTLLGRTGAPRAATELTGLAASKDPTLRIAAIDALGALGSASPKDASGIADDALVPLLVDTDPAVRLHVATALGSSGGNKARQALLKKLDGGEELDRYAVFAALGGIGERLPDDGATARLFRELAVAAGPERDAVLEAAGRSRTPAALKGLENAANGDPDDRRMVATVLAGHRGSAQALGLAQKLAEDPDATVRAQAVFSLGTLGDARSVASIAARTKTDDTAVATNAAGAVARVAQSLGPAGAAVVGPLACPLLSDARATVRSNALVALSFTKAHCGDDELGRKLLLDDESELVRASAARALQATAAPTGEGTSKVTLANRTALERCAATDRNAEVARLCRAPLSPPTSNGSSAARAVRAVTVFVLGEPQNAAKPHAAYLLEYEGGVLRAGIADRRGATFDPAAPAGNLTRRRVPSR